LINYKDLSNYLKINLKELTLFFFLSVLVLTLFNSGWINAEIPLYPSNSDLSIWVNMAYRYFNSEIPLKDFTATMGPGMPILLGNSFKFFGLNMKSFGQTAGLINLFIFGSYYFLNKRNWKLSQFTLLLIILYTHFYFYMPNYNYYGQGIISIALLEAFSFQRATTYRNSSWVFGFLFASLIFLKYPYAIYVIGFLVGSLVFNTPTRKWITGFFISSIFGVMLWSIGFNFNFELFYEQMMISKSIRGDIVLKSLLESKMHIRFFHKYIWGILTFSFFLLYSVFKVENRLIHKWKYILIPIGFFFAQNIVNSSGSDWPVPFAKFWVIIVFISYACFIDVKENKKIINGMILVSLLTYGFYGIRTFYGSHISYSHKKIAISSYQNKHDCNGVKFVCLFEDSIHLLKKYGFKKPEVFPLTYENPYPAYFKTKGIKGNLTHWSHIDSFNLKFHPNITAILKQADVVLEPLVYLSDFHKDAYSMKKKIFYSELTKMFTWKDSSKYWSIWIKKTK
jgi:hypothetical protein